MSLHFSANQYEDGYRGCRLGNWEVGRVYQERPRHRRGTTRVIADDRGHLLPGVARSNASPWTIVPCQESSERQQQQQQQQQQQRQSDLQQQGNSTTAALQPTPTPAATPTPTAAPPTTAPIYNSDDEQEGDEGLGLQVTGAGLLSGKQHDEGRDGERRNEERRGERRDERDSEWSGSSLSSGSITPATFRRNRPILKNNNKNSATVARGHKGSSYGSRTPSSTASTGVEGPTVPAGGALTKDTVEDALLPPRPEEELVNMTGSRALAIRLVDHPAPTNCTKYVVLRPNTAPTPQTTKPPLLPKRPKTAKIIKKVPEIEFALKWDLKENDILEEAKEEEEVEVINVKKVRGRERGRDLPSPRSVSSVDSGIHVARTAWAEGPDSDELVSRLKHLESDKNTADKHTKIQEPESGYGTPKSRDSGSLPSVGSRVSSGRGSVKLALRKPVTPNGRPVTSQPVTPTSQHSTRISIDSQKLAHKSESRESCRSSRRSERSVRSGKRDVQSDRNAQHERTVQHDRTIQRDVSGRAHEKIASPQPRDPLAIMETLDSVFHTVPLRDTGRSTHPHTQRSAAGDKQQHLAVAATQTDEAAHMLVDAAAGTQTSASKMRHNHPGQLRSRNCMACEMRAMEDPPKKFQGPSDYKPAFRAGKVQQQAIIHKQKYLRQSERYNARLRARHQPPRYWPINTLSSPFCNRSGYGQDQYPDHMRLRSTYNMAHDKQKAPTKHHKSLLGKLYQ